MRYFLKRKTIAIENRAWCMGVEEEWTTEKWNAKVLLGDGLFKTCVCV